MEENRKHIDELFREALGNYTETPPSSVWDNVEQRLDATSRKPRPPFWWAWFAVLFLVIAAGGTLVVKHWLPSKGNTSETTTTPPINTPSTLPTQYPTTKPATTEKKSNTVIADKTATNTNSPTTGKTSDKEKTSTAEQHAKPDNLTSKPDGNDAAEKKATGKKPHHGQHVHAVSHKSNGAASVGKSQTSTVSARTPKGKHTSNAAASTAAVNNNTTSETTETPEKKVHKIKAHSTPTASRSSNKTAASAKQPAKQKHLAKQKATTPANNSSNPDNNTAAKEPKPQRTAVQKTVSKKKAQQPIAIATTPKPAVPASDNTNPKKKAAKKNSVAKQKTEAKAENKLAGKPVDVPEKKKAPRHVAAKPVVKVLQPNTPKQPKEKYTTPPSTAAKTKKQPVAKQSVASKKKETPKPIAKATEPPVSVPKTPKDDNPTQLNSRPSGDQNVKFPSAEQHEREKAKEKPVVTTGPDTSDNPTADTSDDAEPYTSPKTPKSFAWNLSPEAGVSVGYSMGFATAHAAEAIIAPYIQLNLGSRVNIRFSPSYRFGNVSTINLSGGGQYYNITAQNVIFKSEVDSSLPGAIDTVYSYFSRQQYDSMNVSYTAGGHTWAIDLPINIGYKISKNFTLFGGPVFSYGNTISVSSVRNETKGIVLLDSIKKSQTLVPQSYFTNLFHRTGELYANAPSTNPVDYGTQFRVGYLAGLRYSKGKFQGELSVQQSLTGMNSIDKDEVKKVYSQPYIRLNIGYQLWQPRKQEAPSVPVEED